MDKRKMTFFLPLLFIGSAMAIFLTVRSKVKGYSLPVPLWLNGSDRNYMAGLNIDTSIEATEGTTIIEETMAFSFTDTTPQTDTITVTNDDGAYELDMSIDESSITSSDPDCTLT